jgi:hypothetical protein
MQMQMQVRRVRLHVARRFGQGSSRETLRERVLDDQQLRTDICWSMFDC